MKHIFILAAIIVISCGSLVAAQSGTAKPSGTRPPPPRPLATPLSPADAGSIIGSIYRNSYFGFQVSIPPGWLVEKDAKAEIKAKDKKAQSPKNEKSQAPLDESSVQGADLLTIYKVPLGTVGQFNAIFMCSIEALPISATRESYMAGMKAALRQVPEPYQILEEGKVETLGGMQFSTMTVILGAPDDQPAKQKYYVTLKKGYALIFATTMFSESDSDMLDWITASIQFNDKPGSTGSDNGLKTKGEQLSFVRN